MNKVYFIGAGPGNPELITLKGNKLINEADIIIYAGSLVNKELFKNNHKAEIYNSTELTLNEVINIMVKALKENKRVVRVHTGDPSLFGAIKEQIDKLEELGIESEIIPGVSSFSAAAATLKKEFTLPNVSQTLILTRMEGRTPVPELESLDKLASHQSSMAIFLSVGLSKKVKEALLKYYSSKTPIAVVVRASWEDEKCFLGELSELDTIINENNIKKTALILVGNFLGSNYDLSKLYDPSFTHEFRKAST